MFLAKCICSIRCISKFCSGAEVFSNLDQANHTLNFKRTDPLTFKLLFTFCTSSSIFMMILLQLSKLNLYLFPIKQNNKLLEVWCIIIMQFPAQQIMLRMGNYYQFIQKSTGKALSMKEQICNEYNGLSPLMENPNDTCLNQVWMIVKIEERDSYQIVHALSTLVLENHPAEIKLGFGSWKINQLFWVEKRQANDYIIREKKGSKNVFYADRKGVLQFGEKQQNCQQIIWTLKIAQKTRAITDSVLFENAFTNLSIDVPESSSKPGIKLIQYSMNKRFNQRFKLIFYPNENFYAIQNVKSQLVLDINQGSNKEGVNIIQWEDHNSLNQRWYLQNQGKDLYLIRSAMNPELFVGIKDNSIKEGAELVTSKSQDFSLWRIMGEFKHQQFQLV